MCMQHAAIPGGAELWYLRYLLSIVIVADTDNARCGGNLAIGFGIHFREGFVEPVCIPS